MAWVPVPKYVLKTSSAPLGPSVSDASFLTAPSNKQHGQKRKRRPELSVLVTNFDIHVFHQSVEVTKLTPSCSVL